LKKQGKVCVITRSPSLRGTEVASVAWQSVTWQSRRRHNEFNSPDCFPSRSFGIGVAMTDC